MYWQVTIRRAPKGQILYLQIKENISYMIILSIMSTPAAFSAKLLLLSR